MKRAGIFDLPLHPIFDVWPTVFYLFTFSCYFVYRLSYLPLFFHAGVLFTFLSVALALVAGIPGLVDWIKNDNIPFWEKKSGIILYSFNVAAFLLTLSNAWLQGAKMNYLSPEKVGDALWISGLALACSLASRFLSFVYVPHHLLARNRVTVKRKKWRLTNARNAFIESHHAR